MSKPPRPLAERFFEKVVKGTGDGCWGWASTHTPGGYGLFSLPAGAMGIAHARRILAHRMAYILVVGPIPEGLVIDHLCRNKGCVNPQHLEPVTQHENIMRGDRVRYNALKTHCPQGHEYSERNTYVSRRGGRSCRACQGDRQRVRRQRLRSEASIRHQEGEGTR